MTKATPNETKTHKNTPNDGQNPSIRSKTYSMLYVKESQFLDIISKGGIWIHRWVGTHITISWVCPQVIWSTKRPKTKQNWKMQTQKSKNPWKMGKMSSKSIDGTWEGRK